MRDGSRKGGDRQTLPEPSNVIKLLKDSEILVAETGKERGTADGGGTTPNKGHLSEEALRKLGEGREGRITDLRDPHIFEYLSIGKIPRILTAQASKLCSNLTSVANCCRPPILMGPSSEA